MPKLVHNSWAWWRTYLSPRGPDGIMRLVLDGHMRCMQSNGRGCWGSVRYMAELTKLNKSTISTWRREALVQGWLAG